MLYRMFLLLSSLLLPCLLAELPCQCKSLTIVESIPDNLTYPSSAPLFPSTTSAWDTLLDLTQLRLDIAVFYWDLRPSPAPADGSDYDGHHIYEGIRTKGKQLKALGGGIRVAQNVPNKAFPDPDSKELAKEGAIDLRLVDFSKLMGGGVLHTKLWIADTSHFYIGSANMDWQSLRQVKEIGILGIDCPCIARDLQKAFDVYWYLTNHTIPSHFPHDLSPEYNMEHPMTVSAAQGQMNLFIVTSPPQFCPSQRTTGIDGLLYVLNSAQKYIYIEVMEYFPALIYTYPNKYWPIIDDALRSAVFDRGVELRLLVGLMPHDLTRADEFHYLASLAALNGSGSAGNVRSNAKLFIIPAYTPAQKKLNYARVNHAKFLVTEKHAYLSTSNWSGDYFTSTGGVSFIMRGKTCNICSQMRAVFDRDWYSQYTKPLHPW